MKKNNRGFTLAELLIVVAIIAVLVAIAIPVFTGQLEKAREATDLANIRSAYGEVVSKYLTDGKAYTATVVAKQTKEGWETTGTDLLGLTLASDATSTETALGGKKNPNSWTVEIDTEGTVTIDKICKPKGTTVTEQSSGSGESGEG